MFNVPHREVDNRLWGVDYPVGVSDLDGKALKKLLVDCVKEILFLGEVVDGCGCPFDCDVEAIEAAEEIVAVKRMDCECFDDGLDFAGYDILADKIRMPKNGSEDSLGQQMLDQHLFDGGLGEVRIN